jgi:hypothetical protein
MGVGWGGVFADPGSARAATLSKNYDQLWNTYCELDQQYIKMRDNRDEWLNAGTKARVEVEEQKKLIAQLRKQNEDLIREYERNQRILKTLLNRAMINEEKDVYHRMHIGKLEAAYTDLSVCQLNYSKDDVFAELKKIKNSSQNDYVASVNGSPKCGQIKTQDVFSVTPG